jgi:hypothetical protein
MNKLVLGVATLALSASVASAQALYPDYGYAPYGYGYAATAPLYDYAAPGFGYAAAAPLYNYAAPGFGYAASAPLYNYAAPGYGFAAPGVAPVQSGTTVVIVTPSPAFAAPTAVSPSLYAYAPGYWGGYGWGGYGRWRAGWWR